MGQLEHQVRYRIGNDSIEDFILLRNQCLYFIASSFSTDLVDCIICHFENYLYHTGDSAIIEILITNIIATYLSYPPIMKEGGYGTNSGHFP